MTSVIKNVVRIASSLDSSPKEIGSDYPIIVSGDFGHRECGRIASSLDLSPKVIGSDYPVIVSSDFSPRECGRIVSSLDLSPKVIRRHSSSYCGLQVVDDDDDIDRKIRI